MLPAMRDRPTPAAVHAPANPALPPARFRVAAVSAPLDAFVECVWSVSGAVPYRQTRVLPNGAVQLMFNLGAPHRLAAVGERRIGRDFVQAWVAGLQDSPITIESPPCTDLVSVRFRPGGAHAFLPLPLDALTGDVVQASDVLGRSAADLHEALQADTAWPAQVAAIERWLLARFAPREFDYRRVQRALAAAAAQPRAPVRVACDTVGLSNRHAIALFRRTVGLAPKTLMRVQRFHATLTQLGGSGPVRGTAQLAATLGFADQAHFANEFRRFAGMTPTHYLARRTTDPENVVVG